MWKMIIGQAIYQLVVTLVLYFAGDKILGYTTVAQQREKQTLVFNTFVWMQIFNALNNRRLDNRFNVFEGIFKNWFFIGIFCIMIAGQVIIVFVGGWPAFQAMRQDGGQWAIALVLGVLSLPIGIVVRLVPDEFAVKCVPRGIRDWATKKKDKVVISDEENPFEFNQALLDIKQELAFIRKYKGGRLNALKFAVQHPRDVIMGSRSPSRSRASSSLPRTPNNELENDENGQSPAPPTPDSRRRRGRSRSNSAFAGAAMAGIVAGSIAGAWSPIDRGHGDGESLRFARERSKSDLSKEIRMEVHPDTKKDDPVVIKDDPVEQAGNAPPSQSANTTPQFGYGPHGGEPSTKGPEEKRDTSAP